MTIFNDQKRFMAAMGQTVYAPDKAQTQMYLTLMCEETCETFCAIAPSQAEKIRTHFARIQELITIENGSNMVEFFDGLLDVTVVTAGAGISAMLPMDEGWDAVIASNMAKVDPVSGKVTRREDGKVLKPPGWMPPNLKQILFDARIDDEF